MPLATRFAVALLLLGALFVVAAAGGWIDRLVRWLQPPFPIVEELGQLGAGQVSSFGATLLEDGRVLLVGGVDTTVGQRTLVEAWVFDPATKRLLPTGPLLTPRADPVVVGLADGRVLVLGGYAEDPTTELQEAVLTAELYDPATGTFRATAAPPAGRKSGPFGAGNDLPWAISQASLLRDGRVFISGGFLQVDASDQIAAKSRADIYDPIGERWSQLDIGCDATRGTQTLVGDRLLILCVTSSGNRLSPVLDVLARLFDPATNEFVDAAKPPAAARQATVLPDGRVLLTGFAPFIYDPEHDAFTTVALQASPSGQIGIAVGSDRVLFLGSPEWPDVNFPTLLLDTAGLQMTTIEERAFGTADAVVQLRDGRILTVGYQLETRLLDPAQLP